jgi:hypothetical protein
MMARSQGISRIILLYLCLVGVLTACSGGNSGQAEALTYISPSPTPQTPLEERVNHQLGTAENPFIMLIKPVNWLEHQIPVMLERLGFDAPITPETNIREGDILRDDLEDLQIALDATFGVRLMTYELEAVQTVADLDGFIKERVLAEVTRTIFERTSLYIDVQFIDYYGQAVNQLCHSDDFVRMAWLDGLSYLATAEQACGDAALMILRGNERDLFAEVTVDLSILDAPPTATLIPDEDGTISVSVETRFTPPALADEDLRAGVAGVLVLNGALGATNPNVLETRTLCRLDDLDFYSSFLPSVILEQIDVIPANIRQMSDVESMLEAVASGDCTGAMVSRDDYDRYADETWFENIRISRTTSAFPYGILTYPLEVEVGVRLSLNEHLVALSQDATDGWYLRLLLGYDAIVEVDPSIIDDVKGFVQELGYDFAQLGN